MKSSYGLTLQIGNCFNLILVEVRAGPQKVLTSIGTGFLVYHAALILTVDFSFVYTGAVN